MKKILMTMVAAFAAVSMNAQMYVGGGIGFTNSTNKTTANEITNTGFSIAPEFGMALDEKMGVGIAVSFGSDKTKNEDKNLNTSTENTVTTINVNPTLTL